MPASAPRLHAGQVVLALAAAAAAPLHGQVRPGIGPANGQPPAATAPAPQDQIDALLPDGTLALAVLRSLGALDAAVENARRGLLDVSPRSKVHETIAAWLRIDEELPGVDMTRPMAFALLDPGAHGAEQSGERLPAVLARAGSFIVPLADEQKFLAALATRLVWKARENGGLIVFEEQRSSFDHEAYMEAVESGADASDLNRFRRTRTDPVFCLLRPGFAILASSRSVADAFAAAAARPPRPHLLDAAAVASVSVDVRALRAAYETDIREAFQQMRSEMQTTLARVEGAPPDTGLVAVLDAYWKLFERLAADTERFEISAREERGGISLSLGLRPVPGSRLAAILARSRPADTGLVNLMPPDACLAFGLDLDYDDAVIAFFEDIVRDLLTRDDTLRDRLIAFLREDFRNYTGRAAFAMDFGPEGFGIAEVVEVLSEESARRSMARWFTDNELLDRMFGLGNGAIRFRSLPAERIGQVDVSVFAMESAESKNAAEPRDPAMAMLADMTFRLAIHRNLVLVTMGPRSADLLRSLFAAVESGGTGFMKSEIYTTALAPFRNETSPVSGCLNLMQLMKGAIEMSAGAAALEDESLAGLLRGIDTRSALGVHVRAGRSGSRILEIHAPVAQLRAIADFVEVQREMSESAARKAQTEMRLRTLAAHLEAYRAQNGRWPSATEGLAALAATPPGGEPVVSPGTLADLAADAWGRQIVYSMEEGDAVLTSLGADGAPGGEGAAADIVLRVAAR